MENTLSHTYETLRMSQEAQSQGELEILRNKNYLLEQEIARLKAQNTRLLELLSDRTAKIDST